MNDVSVVMCTKDTVATIEACLRAVLANRPGELIVVDGLSTDGTCEVAGEYASRVVSDGGKGLAFARNLGLETATKRYVAYVGPDNILQPGTLDRMVLEKERNGWVGVSAVTRILNPADYLSWCMDKYKAIRFSPGERSVIGTPTLFDRDILSRFRFDPDLTSSDDADLCARLTRVGYRLGIADVVVYEIGTCSLRNVLKRWLWYGQSDAEYYWKYSDQWTKRRKLFSLSHPLRSELLKPGWAAVRGGDLLIIPFLLLITAIRYFGWARSARRIRRVGALVSDA